MHEPSSNVHRPRVDGFLPPLHMRWVCVKRLPFPRDLPLEKETSVSISSAFNFAALDLG